ncbi:N-acetylmuramoyl-L-alanine amidase [Levilactobacillus spicheri]|uniref:Cell wall amidase lytH n=2 Tax=Levilactobacillus spicheri TaxID=216463 RepID=A0A0F3RQH3_9LACO|nr:N-acetylmuramoyl-L-alanine amidase [Levilactobacillus spicheri]KJW12160.1 N-acetylmuramoyl-L-alanine amidase [Levilactobacillus spicheri]KRL50072.1 N-acetylmuramoyl-L-alanine amidase [Levilactobacillus spicheri DSM 15429]GEO65822.1 putative cell wall amidase lytH [Levilactobacillus spicheri]
MHFKPKNWVGLVTSLIILLVAGGLLMAFVRNNAVTATVSNLNLRRGPGLTYGVTSKVAKNSRLTIIGEKDNWYHVRDSQNHFGWVASWLVDHPGNLKQATTLSEATIVLDPGHGGSDSGALSIDQKHDEKTYTLELAQRVAKLLRAKGAHVIMTRSSDTSVSLADRPALANTNQANAFISFHFDSSPTDNLASGTTTYYYHRKSSYALAEAINREMDDLPLTNRGIRFGNFEVIRDNSRPSLLLEMGYINTKKDFSDIRSAHYQQTVANNVVQGLSRYFAAQN